MTKKRPAVLKGKTIKCPTTCGAMYITINYEETDPREIQLRIGKTGSCVRAMLEIIGILFSILLQAGIERDKVVRTLKKHIQGVECGSAFVQDKKKYSSCLDYAAQALIKELEAPPAS